MWPYFNYKLRKQSILYLPGKHFRGSLIWNNLPRDIESSKSVSQFKTKIKNLEILISDG